MYYYAYLIKFNAGQFYIGSRTSKVTPEDDKKYWGSPVTYKHLWKDTTLEKTKHILKVCSNFDEMMELEVKLIKEAWKKFPNECLNRCASPAFHPKVTEEKEKNFILKSPTGEIVKGKNIRKFCRDNNLNQGGISSVLAGKIRSCKGWTLPEPKVFLDKNTKQFTLKSPTGEIIEGKNVSKFCRENNLNRAEIFKVFSGRAKSHKGWSLPETKKIGHESSAEKKSKQFTLRSPTGEIVKGKNISKFCRENNLNQGTICSLFSGKVKSHKGWTLP